MSKKIKIVYKGPDANIESKHEIFTNYLLNNEPRYNFEAQPQPQIAQTQIMARRQSLSSTT